LSVIAYMDILHVSVFAGYFNGMCCVQTSVLLLLQTDDEESLDETIRFALESNASVRISQ